MFLFIPAGAAPPGVSIASGPRPLPGGAIGVRSVGDVAAEVRRALELFPQAQEIFFDDDTFTADGERAQQIAKALAPLQMHLVGYRPGHHQL